MNLSNYVSFYPSFLLSFHLIKAAYEAYMSWIGENPSMELGTLPGVELDHKQLFFLSFGQV